MLSVGHTTFTVFGTAVAPWRPGTETQNRRRDGQMVPYWRFGRPLAWHQRALWGLVRLLRPLMGIAVGGVERIPRSGPAVVIAPHFAFLDAFPYLSLSLPRPARFLASAYFVFANRILCRLMYVGGVIPVWRHRPDPTGVRKAL